MPLLDQRIAAGLWETNYLYSRQRHKVYKLSSSLMYRRTITFCTFWKCTEADLSWYWQSPSFQKFSIPQGIKKKKVRPWYNLWHFRPAGGFSGLSDPSQTLPTVFRVQWARCWLLWDMRRPSKPWHLDDLSPARCLDTLMSAERGREPWWTTFI